MKTKVLLLAIICSAFAIQVQGQSKTYVTARNSEISDNLDLRVVASVFGDSKDLSDFERKLNDPQLQISNLDLNNDNRVDYLRVIESVENHTHVVIIQSVLNRDVYQDVATIEIEKDRYNRVQIQVVGNTYLYGHNYIFEPVFYRTPYIYASLWTPYYRPYYSTWTWNYYPTHYYAWNPYPAYRYRYNVSACINTYNNYNYVNHRRSNNAVRIYNSNCSKGYEKQHPSYAFSKRNTNVNNRYEYDQMKNNRNSYNEKRYVANNTNYSSQAQSHRGETPRNYSQSNNQEAKEYISKKFQKENTRETESQRSYTKRDYSQNKAETSKEETPRKAQPQKNDSQIKTESKTVDSPSRYSYTNERSYSAKRNNNRS